MQAEFRFQFSYDRNKLQSGSYYPERRQHIESEPRHHEIQIGSPRTP